jgi:hypothetical protein
MGMVTMRLLFTLLSVFVLSGCVTGYYSGPGQISSCSQFQDKHQEQIAQQLGPEAQLDILNRSAADRYKEAVPEDSTVLLEPIVVRYSEAGNLSNRCDYSRALWAVRDVPGSKIVMVFVHGWRNDSGHNSDRVYNYDEQLFPEGMHGNDLRNFAEMATEISRETDTPVIPIYISWKAATGLGPIDYLTFWNRKGAADRIARNGEINRLIGAIENIAAAQEGASGDKRDVHVVFLGHSFGSRILLHTLVADITTRTQLAHPTDFEAEQEYSECETNPEAAGTCVKPEFAKVTSPADLVVLINPAVEGASYRAIDEFRYARASFGQEPRAQLLILQSESDKPVRVAFPVGQFLGGGMTRNRFNSVGFTPFYQTHALTKKQDENKAELKELVITPKDGEPFPAKTPFAVALVDETILDGHVWFNRPKGAYPNFNSDSPDIFNDWLRNFVVEDFISKRNGSPGPLENLQLQPMASE